MSALRALVAERIALPRTFRLPAVKLPALNPRLLVAAAAAVVLLAAGWLWFRDSSFVAVHDVTITGLSNNAEAPRIRAALDEAAQGMTTLHVSTGDLQAATHPYPIVKRLRVSSHFPHGLSIAVVEEVPVAAVAFQSQHLAVTADGTVLHGVPVESRLPVVAVSAPPGGDRLADPRALAAVAVLAAAPAPLRARVERVVRTRHGITLSLRAGPDLYFGTPERLAAKWLAAARVLADPAARGASYVDLRIPERPGAGGLEDPAAQADAAPTAPTAPAVTGGQPAPAAGTTAAPAPPAPAAGTAPSPAAAPATTVPANPQP